MSLPQPFPILAAPFDSPDKGTLLEVYALPRVGELVQTADGRWAEVVRVMHLARGPGEGRQDVMDYVARIEVRVDGPRGDVLGGRTR